MEHVFGKYELVEKIGVGGMAEVFLAKSFGAEGLEKVLVIKRILPDYSNNRRFVEMFISEAKIAMDLNHPNVVQIYDFGKVDQTYFLAMEFVDGSDLAHIVSSGRRAGRVMPLGDAVYVGVEIAKGLDYAHRRKDHFGNDLSIVHRDVSPQNVLISREGTVKIVDFGIAKATSVTDENPHIVKGKFSYMSPEQASGRVVDQRSDVFSLGVVLFELVCGRPLFKHTTQQETLSLVKSAVVPDISSLNPNVPQALEQLLYRTLSLEPSERPGSARELQLELTRILYSMGEIHDSMTLAQHVASLDGFLSRGPDHQSTAVASGSVGRTVPGGGRTATGGTMVQTSNTPVTRIAENPPPDAHLRERKECVILAGSMQGLFGLRQTLGQDRWLQVLQEYTRIIDSIAFKNDAIVHRVNEDGFTLLFGMPVSSENDAERAVRVSMDLHEAIAGMNPSLASPLQLSIGLAIGDVVLEQEVDKTGRRFTWSFYGHSHELADQLARAAMSREVLLGGQVFRRVRREYKCEKVDSLRYSDDSDAAPLEVQAYRLIELKSQQDKISEVKRSYHGFFGRELILRGMREQYRNCHLESRAGAIVLRGRPGIGKSTLIEEFLRGLDGRSVRVLRGVVPPYERDVPLGALAGLLAEMLRLGERDDLRQVRTTLSTRVYALFADESAEEKDLLCHSLGTVFGIRNPSSSFEDLAGDERRDRIFLSLRKLLTRFAEKLPLVLAIDDAHNLDSMTVEFGATYFSSTQNAPTIFVLTVDPSNIEESPVWSELLGSRYVWTEDVDELSEVASSQLVTELLRHHRVEDKGLSQEILRRSGGNPLFIKEVVEVLRDRGLLKLGQDVVGNDSGTHWLPSSVDGLLRARIDQLDLDEKTALQHLSLLWSPFSGGDATLVLEQGAVEKVKSLVDRGLLVEVVNDEAEAQEFDKRHFRFCNALTQDVAARGLIPEESTELHRRLAAYLLDIQDERRVYSNALIARHFDGAGEKERSVEFYFEAAGSALQQYGAAESLRLCDKVLERVSDDSGFRFEALHIKAQALSELGKREECGAVLQELVKLSTTRDNPNEHGYVLLQLARFEFDQAELRKAKAYTMSALELAGTLEEAEKLELEAEVRLTHAMILLSEGAREEALLNAREAAEYFARLDGEKRASGMVRSWDLIGVLQRQAGHHALALEAFERGLATAQGTNLRRERRHLLSSAGVAMAYLGQFSQALERYEEALLQCRQLGHQKEEAELLVNIGHAHLLRGDVETAITTVRRGNYLARKSNSHAILANGLITLGGCHIEKNEWLKAEHALQEGLRVADSIPNVYLSVHATLLLAQVNLGHGHSEQARIAYMQAEDALERSESASMTWGIAAGHMLMARAQKILGNREDAIATSRKAIAVIDDGELYAIEEVLYHHAQILPDEPEYQAERVQALRRAREVLFHRRDMMKDAESKAMLLDRDINRQILSVAALVVGD